QREKASTARPVNSARTSWDFVTIARSSSSVVGLRLDHNALRDGPSRVLSRRVIHGVIYECLRSDALRNPSKNMTLTRLADDGLDKYGEYVALAFEGRQYTNVDQQRAASRLAHALRRLGIAPGDRVVVMLPN